MSPRPDISSYTLGVYEMSPLSDSSSYPLRLRMPGLHALDGRGWKPLGLGRGADALALVEAGQHAGFDAVALVEG